MKAYVDGIQENAIKFNIDRLEDDGAFFRLEGWIYSENSHIDEIRVVVANDEEEAALGLEWKKRKDVVKAFDRAELYCGFSDEFVLTRGSIVTVFLEYQIGTNIYRMQLCVLGANKTVGNIELKRDKVVSFTEFKNDCVVENIHIAEAIYHTTIDLLVPVYNGYEYLENLFAGIEKTRVPYRLFIVDDCSPDERVLPFLENYAKGKKNVKLLKNKKNLGFVATLNKALQHSKNHVVIINTDVILPEGWLERLMTPILEDHTIASTTPYTNSATICSFPNFCENNDIYLGLPVDEIDAYFAHMKPQYVEMPTGVGFCMGMNRQAIKEVGNLDAETFYKGYGEENDWCQRAIKQGFRNVQVENLFVWHKHGGSFASEDKQRYIERNLQIIDERYPNYNLDVARFIAYDPNSQIREYLQYKILHDKAEDFVFIINHNWGGGANTYLDDKLKEILDAGKGVVQFIEDAERGFFLVWQYQDQEVKIAATDYDEAHNLVSGIKCSEILINEMVAFKDIKGVQKLLLELKNEWNAKLSMLCHDFFAICPSIYLTDDKRHHCFLPEDIEQCRKCYEKNPDKLNEEYDTIDEWREMWKGFLEQCDEVICFSENTKSYYEKCYPNAKYSIRPHQVDYIEPVGEYEKTEGIVTIGIIGNFMYSKGAEIICRMAEIINDNFINARIVVIGTNLYSNAYPENIIMHGKYQREELPELIKQYEIDLVFIASIWPETFSYTTEEAIKMGIPVASFDIGAPAERVKKYDKGLIIDEISAVAALREIMKFVSGNDEGISTATILEHGVDYKEKREVVLRELNAHVFDWYPFDTRKNCLIAGKNTEFVENSISKQLEQITVVEEISEVDEQDRYDYVILCGLNQSADVEIARGILAENGKILLMTDNRIGLRYLMGTLDHHTEDYFSGANDYTNVHPSGRGYTKNEIIETITDAGFHNYKFYYLYPNEKTTKEVFTDETITSYGYGKEYHNFDYGTLELYSERRMAETLKNEQMITEFANYYVVEISDSCEFAPVLYAKINGFRKPTFQIMTEIIRDGNEKSVRKIGLTADAIHHVQKICDHHDGNDVQKIDGGVACEFITCETLDDKITSLIEAKRLDQIYEELSEFFEQYFEAAMETTYDTPAFIDVFGSVSSDAVRKMACIKPANIDLICENIMLQKDGYSFIDEEWIFDFYVPVKFILWRNIRELFATHVTLVDLISYEDFLRHFDMDMDMDRIFLSWTNHFVNDYVGVAEYEKYSLERKQVDLKDWYLNNCNAAEAKLYFDFGEGFSEEHRAVALLETQYDGYFEATYLIPKGVRSIMWKPVELRCCECAIEVEGGTIEKHNGVDEAGKTYFKGSSAEYYIKIHENVEQIVIRGYIKMADMAESVSEYGKELYKNKQQLQNSSAQIQDITAQLQNTSEQLNSTIVQLNDLQNSYDDIMRSKAWKCVQIVRRILRR